jgi:Zn-dependent peptidase ImmA (M78 family)
MKPSIILRTRFPGVAEGQACRLLIYSAFPHLESASRCVDLEALADSAGIKVSSVENAAFDGVFTWDAEGNNSVAISKSANEKRERFTLAHEIGHWLLHEKLLRDRSGNRFRGNSQADPDVRDEERLANMIAAEILLPFQAICETVERNGINNRTLGKLAEAFCVSRAAAFRRVADVVLTTLVYLCAIPTRFHDRASVARIDDAIYAFPMQPLVYDRDSARLLGRIPFNEVGVRNGGFLGFRGSCGRVSQRFDAVFSDHPLPRVHLLAHSVTFQD